MSHRRTGLSDARTGGYGVGHTWPLPTPAAARTDGVSMASLVDDLTATGLAGRGDGPRVAFDSWTEQVRHSLLSFEFECARPGAFRGTVSHRWLAGVGFFEMESEAHAAHRQAGHITPAESGLYLMTLQLSGQFRMTQGDRTAVLTPGRFALYDSARPAELAASDDYRSVCLRFPGEWVGAAGDDLADITATSFDCDAGLASTVWAMALGVHRSIDTLGEAGPLAVRNLMDLVTAMLRDDLGRRGLAGPDPEASLLRSVRRHIDARLADPGLAPAGVAAAHYVSTRYLHRLFEATGTTVAAWIRARRVQMCRRDLADPRLARLPVASIGARWGLTGASHFGQVFKRETGRSPADYRRAALTRGRRSPR